MGEDSTNVLSNVAHINNERIQGDLGKFVRGSVEEIVRSRGVAEGAQAAPTDLEY
ncbi:MAG: hypothetical protein MN733_35575 [Nitrososphaera sp.]|nr:hypothetical protein [Nitrososphaera sp.]